jgi:nucleotide-binding universal stress UspA family protein
MPIKDLLVYVDATTAGTERLALAARLARRCGAHLVGVHVRGLLEPARAAGYASFEQVYRALDNAATQREAAAQAAFQAAIAREGIAGEWRASRVATAAEAVVHARYVDLALVGQSNPDDDGPMPLPAAEDLLLDSGRPVLVVPYAGRFADIGRRVLIGWNASREAARAVNDALPLLADAAAVTVLAVNPAVRATDHGEVPGADIGVHLARHGVKVAVETAHVSEIAASDVLLNRAADLGADLIVTGGYGRSRLRELVLGGVTRDLLRRMTVPVLMSH